MISQCLFYKNIVYPRQPMNKCMWGSISEFAETLHYLACVTHVHVHVRLVQQKQEV